MGTGQAPLDNFWRDIRVSLSPSQGHTYDTSQDTLGIVHNAHSRSPHKVQKCCNRDSESYVGAFSHGMLLKDSLGNLLFASITDTHLICTLLVVCYHHFQVTSLRTAMCNVSTLNCQSKYLLAGSRVAKKVNSFRQCGQVLPQRWIHVSRQSLQMSFPQQLSWWTSFATSLQIRQ